jgi:IS30 family transposase
MAQHAACASTTTLAVYLCDSHSPGSAARTRTPTGCCASTAPKSTDLSRHIRTDLRAVAPTLSGRPARLSTGATPTEPLMGVYGRWHRTVLPRTLVPELAAGVAVVEDLFGEGWPLW